MRRKILAVMLAISLLAIAFSSVSFLVGECRAQLNYDFSLEEEFVDIQINKDGSTDISYEFHFINYGDLDGVDIGLPNEYYDLATAWAEIEVENQTYTPSLIHESPWIPVGVAVEFSPQIRAQIENPGQDFILRFRINNPKMVWVNELVEGGVGIQFMPTWFSTDFQRGATGYLRARILFPPGFTDLSQAVYLEGQPWDYIEFNATENLAIAVWEATDVSSDFQSSGGYDVGVGFPSSYVDKYYKHSAWGSLWSVVTSAADLICINSCCIIFALIITVPIAYRIWWRKRTVDYFEPKMTQVGAGPRRDLTAVEAAIILEKPLDMVATMMLFGLVKKGAITIKPNAAGIKMAKTGKKADGILLYEQGYLDAVTDDGLMDSGKLEMVMSELIKTVEKKLDGFDYTATKRYYGKICDKAWDQVKSAGTPEIFASSLKENNEWMMLDRNYEGRMYGLDSHPFVFLGHHHGSATGAASPINVKGMAQSYVSQVRASSSTLVTDIKSFAASVTNRTNPPSSSQTFTANTLVSSGGRGKFGGGGGGCACACACACAGGGR